MEEPIKQPRKWIMKSTKGLIKPARPAANNLKLFEIEVDLDMNLVVQPASCMCVRTFGLFTIVTTKHTYTL